MDVAGGYVLKLLLILAFKLNTRLYTREVRFVKHV